MSRHDAIGKRKTAGGDFQKNGDCRQAIRTTDSGLADKGRVSAFRGSDPSPVRPRVRREDRSPGSTKNLILPEITQLEPVRSEVDVAICDLGSVTMGEFQRPLQNETN